MDTLDEIYEYVNTIYGIDIKSDTRKRDYVEGRALFYVIARNKTNYSLTCLGEYLNKHHATVIHAINNVSIHLNKEILAKAFLHFNLIEDAPKETIAYLKDKTNKLENELKVTEEALRIMPRLSKVTAKLNRLTEEQKQRANRRNVLQFETIDRCLSEVESTIDYLEFEI